MRLIAAVSLLAAVAIAGVLVAGMLGRASGAERAVERYRDAWSRGDDVAAARVTSRPAEAGRALRASRRGLDGARVAARVVGLKEDGDRAGARLRVTWRVPRYGRFSYDTRLQLRRDADRWAIVWRPAMLHPKLDAGSRLGTARTAARRGRIVDRRGRALVTERAVVDVAVEVRRVREPAVTARRLAQLLDVDARRLARAIRRARRGQFVPVITLRRAAYERIADELQQVRGSSLLAGTAPLAPTKSYGRALLGTVAPATAEQLARLGKAYRPGDEIGQWGLQAVFEKRLAGIETREVVIRSTARRTVLARLARKPGRHGRSLRTTLDRDAQAAAERALGSDRRNAALVAVQPSSGDMLAVANRPADSSFNRALEGRYPPGSTFKVVSTAALLRDGLDVDATVPCPPTATIDGRAFRNFEGQARGRVPFRTDFAQSCNTAFVSLGDRLEPGVLTDVARSFGLGHALDLALPAARASVPAARAPVARAAMMIGQDRILASPLQMAGVAATVAAGRWRAPRLAAGDPRRAAEPLPEAQAATLRELMRAVVTSGTGTALAGVGGEPAGKSGTAEYGGGDPPPTHAWFIALRGDLALAVLVEGGRAGGTVAAPIAARFFAALDRADRRSDVSDR
jgi:cell division protein FtsI/penicillin-binding protein 2